MMIKVLKCISDSLCELVQLQNASRELCDKAPVTHVLVSGTNTNIPAGLKSVTINNITGITTINGGYALGNGRRDNSISFSATESDCVTGLLPDFTLAGGTWQWIGLEEVE